MKDEVMNVEVMENKNDEVIDQIVPVAEVIDDENSESALSKRDMIIGGAILGLAAAGAVALGRGIFKGGKAIVKKIKEKATKDKEVIAPVTAPIDEQPYGTVIETEDGDVLVIKRDEE